MTASPARQKPSQLVRILGMVPAGLLLMMAGFIGLFFDDATESEVTTYWIGLLIACVAIGITAFSARIGLILSLALLVPCALLANAFHGSPVRIFGLPAFPLTCIALILTAANLTAIVIGRWTPGTER
jgi:hypothetical protein